MEPGEIAEIAEVIWGDDALDETMYGEAEVRRRNAIAREVWHFAEKIKDQSRYGIIRCRHD